jgi:hypothetical protein
MLALVALLPIAVILFVSKVVELVPVFVEAPGPPHDGAAKDIAADLSAELSQIALLVIGGCAILFREQRSREISRGFLVYSIMVFSAAVASCFAGFRYRFALAQQLAYARFDFDAISNRLAWQIWLLVLALSAFMVLAVLAYIPAATRNVEPRAPEPGRISE